MQGNDTSNGKFSTDTNQDKFVVKNELPIEPHNIEIHELKKSDDAPLVNLRASKGSTSSLETHGAGHVGSSAHTGRDQKFNHNSARDYI